MTKKRRRPRCPVCHRAFTPARRGRPQLYCSRSHRQRAYETRRALVRVPSLLLGRGIDAMRTKAGIERAVVDVLRKYAILLPAPKTRPRLQIVKKATEEK